MKPLDKWWIRIILTIVIAALVITSGAVSGLPQWLIPIYLYGLMTVALIGVELNRTCGSLFTSGLGLTPVAPRHAGLGILYAIGALLLIGGAAYVLGAEFVPANGSVEITGIVALFAASAGEEIVFRGTMFEAIRERFGPSYAVGIMATFFGLVHAANPGASVFAVINVTIAGVMFGVMAVQSRSIWMPILFHITWNLFVRLFFGNVSGGEAGGGIFTLDTSGIREDIVWLVDGPFGIEQGVITTVVLLGVIVITIGFVKSDRMVQAARTRRDRTVERGML